MSEFRKEYELKIIDKRVEAKDAVTLRFEIPEELKDTFNSKAGQFIGVTANINGEEVHRSYSLSSSPLESGFQEISIKKIPDGKMSTYLVDVVKKGETLKVVPPTGHFYKESENEKNHVMFAAGSGVTPMLSIIKYLKEKKPNDQISLFYWNQTIESTMFYKELNDLMDTMPKLHVHWAFTKEEVKDCEIKERVSDKNLKNCYYNWSVSLKTPVFYLCGPESFMQTVEIFLGTKGYDSEQIRKENFFLNPEPVNVPKESIDEDGKVLVGDKSVDRVDNGIDSKGVAVLDGDVIEVSFENEETILEALLRSGENPPYSCMEGTCIACQCKVTEGLVSMPSETFLTEDELEEGYILSCQAFPRSKSVKVDFDDV